MTNWETALRPVHRSLGRDASPIGVPAPPTIDETAVRLSTEASVGQFIERATAAKIHVHPLSHDELREALVLMLRTVELSSVVLTRSPLIERVGLLPALRAVGIDARYWDESTLDASYDVDVGITDVYAAVAETGSIVVRSSPAHGRAVSLVPPYHIAIVERSQIVPDLIDLFAKIAAEGTGSGVVIITGPSKTADIEMNLVVGVHGPGEVHVFLVD